MKYYTFYKENNEFDDVLTDVNLKKVIDETYTWYQHIRIGIRDEKAEQLASYITLKFGDNLRNELTKDYSPVMYVDYMPKKKN